MPVEWSRIIPREVREGFWYPGVAKSDLRRWFTS
jgi:hypothetical protein